jgi:pimeloyl-ACP methyl ester carboxylesterase
VLCGNGYWGQYAAGRHNLDNPRREFNMRRPGDRDNMIVSPKVFPMISALHARPLIAALCLFGVATVAYAQKKPSSQPAVLRTPIGITEVGLLGGAAYRIDVPADWNHSLVVYYHGYTENPAGFHIAAHLDSQTQPMFQRHYAIVQSGYSQAGWALQQAYPETEQLRKYFVHAYGQPRETYVAGRSMGGALVMVTLELNPKPYLGGLDLCGAVGPSYEPYQRRFAWRAAFDYYFPGIMPTLVPSPPSFEETPALREKALAALRANPAAATEMRELTDLHTDNEVARMMVYFTYVISDMQKRAGGNPFDNRNYIYTGTNGAVSASDYALNDGVHRYTADPKAREYLIHHYTPSGRLGRPMLALHTVYDPLIPATTLSLYSHQVEMAGAGQNLVQQYVHRDGHCTFSEEEVGHAFDELVQWTHGSPRPIPGLLRLSTENPRTAAR